MRSTTHFHTSGWGLRHWHGPWLPGHDGHPSPIRHNSCTPCRHLGDPPTPSPDAWPRGASAVSSHVTQSPCVPQPAAPTLAGAAPSLGFQIFPQHRAPPAFFLHLLSSSTCSFPQKRAQQPCAGRRG